MAIAEIEACSGGGGGITDPLVILSRSMSGNTNLTLDNDYISQYKYVKLMTQAEYTTHSGNSTASSWITVTSCDWYTNGYVDETKITLSTTAVEISTVTLGNLSSFAGGACFAIMFYND